MISDLSTIALQSVLHYRMPFFIIVFLCRKNELVNKYRVCDKFIRRFSRRRPVLPKIFPTVDQDTAAQDDNEEAREEVASSADGGCCGLSDGGQFVVAERQFAFGEQPVFFFGRHSQQAEGKEGRFAEVRQ
jgi:hypothetical protein